MRRIFFIAITALTGAVATIPASAQQTSTLQVGTRARVFLPQHKRLAGSISRLDGDSITIQDSKNQRTIALSDISRVQIGKRNRPLGALKYALIGTAVGAATGALIGAATYQENENCFLFCDRTSVMAISGMAIGVLGLGVGIVSGAIVGETTWRDIPPARNVSQ